ncbi:uncharacterized protein N7503_009360, partial [Penicillium pulvis]|uniref:uncharacterized protein n=1 Tax=Penicillium pulvis TaxID=1562058 RepID=UPI002548C16F
CARQNGHRNSSLAEVLVVAKNHPFYNPDTLSPVTSGVVQEMWNLIVQNNRGADACVSLRNKYRHSSYLSITGGGSGGIFVLFAVDAYEHR